MKTTNRRKTGFDRGQQGIYRPLVQAAWEVKCRELGQVKTDKGTFDAWRKSELACATGKESTVDCGRDRDFEKACAHFEALVGEDFYWQNKLESGDENRLTWRLKKDYPAYFRAKFGGNRSVRDYLLTIASSVAGRPISHLWRLSDGEIQTVRQAMVIAAARWEGERSEEG